MKIKLDLTRGKLRHGSPSGIVTVSIALTLLLKIFNKRNTEKYLLSCQGKILTKPEILWLTFALGAYVFYKSEDIFNRIQKSIREAASFCLCPLSKAYR
ncbi:hypothetical protein CSA56_06365 [candidate division KSB3 bacterium]|uniref:Uncharacterized protein n=1 Tax=candidate division KSB3 bacterium TaxID=2044937 RepID=A0A2G6KGT8_9BACT|nr:MAG: hypothetical protein CSA56_06365 [candidate division KSB3 bacterium]